MIIRRLEKDNKVSTFEVKDHTFVVCAYKESQYLEDCIVSLLKQELKSQVIIATSTPNEFIKSIAAKYYLPVYENKGISGIAGDWNFAISCADTALVTIAHQDDVYLPNYTKKMLSLFNKAEAPILYSSNYAEIRNGISVYCGPLITAKKMMTFPMLLCPKSKQARRFAISYGNGICCPSVTYVTDYIKKFPFETGMKSNLDWARWAELSKLDGSFLYCPTVTMLHRIHADAETSKLIGENARFMEDFEMFKKFHSETVSKLLIKIYALGEKSYKKR